MRFEFDDRNPALDAAVAYAAAHPATQRVNLDPLYVYAAAAGPRRVALLSGGGSGHEPLHGGFVGPGGLDAAVPGRIFASPHSRQIYEAALRVAGPDGVLFLVKNYTGDVVNFGIAAERVRAHGIPVEILVIADDIATADTGDMRGTAATVVVEQVLGAMADAGAGLAELRDYGADLVGRSRSIALADVAHHSHVTGERAFETSAGVEFGVGIHGERAKETVAGSTAAELVTDMVDELLGAIGASEEPLALLVNDLGAMSGVETASILGHAARTLTLRGRDVALVAEGPFVTALDMRGFSLTLVELDARTREILAAAAPTIPLPRWDRWMPAEVPEAEGTEAAEADARPPRTAEAALAVVGDLVDALHGGLTRLDQRAGDGDFGDNMAFAVQSARARWASGSVDAELHALRDAFLDDVGGSSGPLFGLVLQCIGDAGDDLDAITHGLRRGVDAVRRLGGAEVGDATMVDALVPAAESLERGGGAADALGAAIDGALSTADLTARRGRARYVGERARGVVDPGAVGAVILVAGVLQAQIAADDASAAVRALVERATELAGD